MAGLPGEVVSRAGEILKNLEESDLDINGRPTRRAIRKRLSDLPGQMTFW